MDILSMEWTTFDNICHFIIHYLIPFSDKDRAWLWVMTKNERKKK